MKSFPDRVELEYLHRIGVKTVIVLKDKVPGTEYADAGSPDAPIDGLGIKRRDDGQSIIYTID